jgi:ligand-binding sensor domain-containing protein
MSFTIDAASIITIYRTGSAPGLKSNCIISLFEDRRGVLWIGTEHGGLTRYAGGKFTTFTTANGLPDYWIRAITKRLHGPNNSPHKYAD